MKAVAYFLYFVGLAAVVFAQNNTSTVSTTSTTTTTTEGTSTTITGNATTTTAVPSELSTTTVSPPVVIAPLWKLSNSNETCILMSGNLTFTITYETKDGKTSSGKIKVPDTAKVSGMCNAYIEMLVLTWPGSSTPTASKQQIMPNNVTFLFSKSGFQGTNATSYSLMTIFGSLVLDPVNFPNATTPGKSYSIAAKLSDFEVFAPVTKSYMCQSYKTITADKTGNVELEMYGVQIEAFHEGDGNAFAEGSVCAKDKALTVLPILAYTIFPIIILVALAVFLYKHYKKPNSYSEV